MVHRAAHLQGASSSALTSSGRTYDAKLVQREMLRLGTLAHQLPSAALATLSNSTAALASASTLVLPSTDDVPASMHVRASSV